MSMELSLLPEEYALILSCLFDPFLLIGCDSGGFSIYPKFEGESVCGSRWRVRFGETTRATRKQHCE
jgi:hypothetical protein